MTTDKKPNPPAESASEPAATQTNEARRAALLRMGAYAASVAPAMLVLATSRSHAAPTNANCDNPGQHLGVKKQGHSNC